MRSSQCVKVRRMFWNNYGILQKRLRRLTPPDPTRVKFNSRISMPVWERRWCAIDAPRRVVKDGIIHLTVHFVLLEQSGWDTRVPGTQRSISSRWRHASLDQLITLLCIDTAQNYNAMQPD